MRLRKRNRYKLVDVTSVAVLHDHVPLLGFSDGCVGEVNLRSDLWGPMFEPTAKDYDEFCNATVSSEFGTIVWPNGADVAPEVLHAQAVPDCAD